MADKDHSGTSFWGVPGASGGDEMREKLEARRKAIEEAESKPAQKENWVDDLFSDLDAPSSSAATAQPVASTGPPKAISSEVDDLFADFDTPSTSPAAPVTSHTNGAAKSEVDDLFDFSDGEDNKKSAENGLVATPTKPAPPPPPAPATTAAATAAAATTTATTAAAPDAPTATPPPTISVSIPPAPAPVVSTPTQSTSNLPPPPLPPPTNSATSADLAANAEFSDQVPPTSTIDSAGSRAKGDTAEVEGLLDDIFGPAGNSNAAATSAAAAAAPAAGTAKAAPPRPPPPPPPPPADTVGPQSFGLADDDEEPQKNIAREGSSGSGKEWYDLKEHEIEDIVGGASAAAAPDSAKKSESNSGSGGMKSFWKQASKLGSKAKKAIIEEAKNVVADVKDLSEGVKEGYQITAQDAKKMTEKAGSASQKWKTEWTQEANIGSWFSGLGSSKDKKEKDVRPTTSTPEAAQPPSSSASSNAAAPPPAAPSTSSSSASAAKAEGDGAKAADAAASAYAHRHGLSKKEAWEAIRQGLSATRDVSRELWNDVRTANKDAVQDLRQGVSDIRDLLGEVVPASTGEEGAHKEAPEAAGQDWWSGLGHLWNPHPQVVEAYWLLPSARANYVELGPASFAAPADEARPGMGDVLADGQAAAEAMKQRLRKVGGQLAKGTQSTSSAIRKRAQDLQHNISSRTAAGSAAADAAGAVSGVQATAVDDTWETDSLFEIGSENDDDEEDEGATNDLDPKEVDLLG